MNKKLFLILFIGIFISINSFGQKSAKRIIGIWHNYSVSIKNIEKLSQAVFIKNKSLYEKQKTLYIELFKEANDSNKMFYQQIIAQIDNKLKTLSLKTTRNSILKNSKFETFTFKKNKTLVIKNEQDSAVATWFILNDSLKLMVNGNKMSMYIKKLKPKKLILEQNSSFDSVSYRIVYFFNKE